MIYIEYYAKQLQNTLEALIKIGKSQGHKTNLNKDKVQNHKDYIFSDHKKVKLKIKGRERLKNEQICGH